MEEFLMLNRQWIATFLGATVVLGGCAEQPSRETLGTAGGAVVGGLLGREVLDSDTGTLIGAVVGAVAGRQLLEQYDRRQAATALEQNQPTRWSNPNTNADYTFTPTDTYSGPDNRLCRQYRTTISVEGEQQVATGTACRRTDGSWEVIG